MSNRSDRPDWEDPRAVVTDVWGAEDVEEYVMVGYDAGDIALVEGKKVLDHQPAIAVAINDDGEIRRLVLLVSTHQALDLAQRMIRRFVRSDEDRDLLVRLAEEERPGPAMP